MTGMPPYRRIVQDVRRRIEAGELRPGDRVPSARAITKEWGVAIATAIKAHAALREEGLTAARPGVGTVVAGPAPPAAAVDLTRERIVTAAIAIADADGLAELTMRRLAAALGVSTMSLYRHVPSRDDLVFAMIDESIGEVRLPPRHPPGWRQSLELVARLEWAVFQRHPWLGPSMSITRPQMVPRGLRLSEWVMAAFDGTALTAGERMYVQILLFSFVRGVASGLEPEAEALRDSGLTADEWMAVHGPAYAQLIDSGGFPQFRALTSQEFDFDLNGLFEFGLARLLDGLSLWIDG